MAKRSGIGGRTVSVLLCLIMLIGLFPAQIFAAGDSVVFKKVSAIEAGGEYLIVAKSGGSGSTYALTNNASNLKTKVTVNSDTITVDESVAASIIWKAENATGDTSNGGSFTFTNGSEMIARKSGSNDVELGSGSGKYYGMNHKGNTIANLGSGNQDWYLGYGSVSGSTEYNFSFNNTQPVNNISFYKRVKIPGGSGDSGDSGDSDDPSGKTGTTVFEKTDVVNAGGEYLIVASSGGNNYALTNNASNLRTEVTVSGDKITVEDSVAANITWKAEAATGSILDGGALTFGNGSNKLSRRSGSSDIEFVASASADRRAGMTYGNGTIYSRGSDGDNQYFGYSSNFSFSKQTTNNISFYAPVNGAGNPSVPADNGDSVYLAFTSDVHNQSNNSSATRLNNWVNNVSSKLGGVDFDTMGFCGDIGTSSDSGDNYWNRVKQVVDTVNSNTHVKNACYTPGNHEQTNGSFNTTTNTTKSNFTMVGEGKSTDDYAVYCFGATQENEIYTDANITKLSTSLASYGKSKPVFIISHYPLHCYNGNS